jgi:predicted N-acetyltransferase YhbS
MEYRVLQRDEIAKLKEIDRAEIIEKVYHMSGGRLELKDEYYDVKNNWWIQEVEKVLLPRLYDLYESGGIIHGAFDNSKITGMVALDNKFIGKEKDQLKLDILYVSKNYRQCGLGKKLMELAIAKAREWGAAKLYISATPTQNTVDFYLSLGCGPAYEINKELFELEPEDIHLELSI